MKGNCPRILIWLILQPTGNLPAGHAVGVSVKYLDLGAINFRDDAGALLEQYKANELAIDVSYARKFGESFAMALTARYFQSDIGSGYLQ